MELVSKDEIRDLINYKRFGSDVLATAIYKLFKLDKINDFYASSMSKNLATNEFISHVLQSLEVSYEVSDADLQRIPSKGPFVVVANHPYGGIDGLILHEIFAKQRPDFKIMANYLLQRVEPLKKTFFGVNPFDGVSKKQSVVGLKLAVDHLNDGHPMAIFPAGEVSTFRPEKSKVVDREWQSSALRFVRNAKVPVVPVYFHGSNSLLFHLLGYIHPLLRTAKLPSELLNKRDQVIQVRIGNPITAAELERFEKINDFGRFLRAKTYALASPLEESNFSFAPLQLVQPTVADIIPEQDPQTLKKEIDALRDDYLLFTTKDFSVFCAPPDKLNLLLREIGRLREITFREVGEGTNKELDLDEFDLYYNQLIIWDEKANTIVGGYRVGKGKEILTQHGVRGFYVRTLFKIDSELEHILAQSLELGRSYIVKEYQRKPLPLYLLWKGILYFLLKNDEYRYLIGPVSISNRFSTLSKNLLIDFVQSNHYNKELSKFVQPRKRFKVKHSMLEDLKLPEHSSLNDLDKWIADIESDLRIPVLLKKYLSLNAKIIGFNIDPKFNDCIDGLLLLDIFDVPFDVMMSFSKDFEDASLTERLFFNITQF